MITTAIGIFALTAILGMLLLSFVMRNKPTPKAVVLSHGALAITGVILLVLYTIGHEVKPIESLVLFVIAASGGLVMISRDLMGKQVPKWLAAVHGIIAVTGFVFLLVFQFSG